MPLILEQSFPLGRFHATRWNQNPFEDRHGEWPPSPWRLLRTITARWFQYARETGHNDEGLRNSLLTTLAASPPVFYLPDMTWRGAEVRQYQPTALDEHYKYRKDPVTKKRVPDYSYMAITKTLSVDCPRVMSATDSIFWVWNDISLDDRARELLEALLRRVLYFGRSESFCRIRVVSCEPTSPFRCELVQSMESGSPVLVAMPGGKLNLESLLACSDDPRFKGRQIPPGTEWRYARLPQCPPMSIPTVCKSKYPTDFHVIQFAVGGHVYPEQAHWVRVIEKFRGCVLKHASRIVSSGKCSSYRELPPDLRDKLKLLSGKDCEGRPVQDHQHAYFFLCPDEIGNPSRLIAYRRSPFDAIADQPFEVEAILAASREPIFWQSRDPDWSLRLVPLPFETPPPPGFHYDDASATVWVSVTPFVPPGGRRRFRKGGHARPGETPAKLLAKLLVKSGFREPVLVEPISELNRSDWSYVHASREERRQLREQRMLPIRAGYRFKIRFDQSVRGPICLGHSCHFGLGLFVPVESS